MLISKIPGNTRDWWKRKVLIIGRHHRQKSELEDFIDFFDNETQLANNPSLKDYNEKADWQQ